MGMEAFVERSARAPTRRTGRKPSYIQYEGLRPAGPPAGRNPAQDHPSVSSVTAAGGEIRQATNPAAASPAMARKLLARNGSVPSRAGANPMPT